MKRKTSYFSGHVQGIGFRYTAQNIAAKHDVRGYVRNLSDGRVELVLEGSDEHINEVLQAIQQKMEGFVRKVQTQESPATGEFVDFSILG